MTVSGTVGWLSSNGGLAIWLAGLTTLFIGLMTVSTQRKINRRRATVDMLMQKIWDKDYLAASLSFYTIMKEQRKLMEFHDMYLQAGDMKRKDKWESLTETEKKKYEHATNVIYDVVAFLNDRELTAIGIREGTYDEVICRRWWYSTFLREWQLASSFVARARTDAQIGNPSPAAYCEMEALAVRWKAEGPWTRQAKHIKLPGGRHLVLTRSR